ncbi:MAG: bifunctional riboflavin kinase/FAD synthetase [Flavobacteriales bacterium]
MHRSISEFPSEEGVVLTIGTFDGVHEGHKRILRKLVEKARQKGGKSVLLTFFPHPRMVLAPDSEIRLLTTMDEKRDLLGEEGIDHLIIQPFTKEFAAMEPEDYIRKVLIEGIGVESLVIGYDHRFGKERKGDLNTLKRSAPEFGFDVEEIPAHLIDDVDVSSTKVRNALYEGDVRTANRYLGQAYTLTGEVVRGDRKGQEMGFPTANLRIPESYKLIPSNGVYAVEVLLRGELRSGMLNIGYTPTLHDRQEASIEVHIFGVEEELYGESITLRFFDRIRDEREFEGMEALRERLEKDRKEALASLKELSSGTTAP